MWFKKAVEKDDVLQALRGVKDDAQGADIVALNMISGLSLSKEGNVIFMIEVDPARAASMEPLRQRAEDAVKRLKGVKRVSAILTAERAAGEETYSAVKAHKENPQAGAQKDKAKIDPHGMDKNPRLKVPVKKIIVVSSGKGGVGKSTISMALAYNLSKNSQLKIGILDADIYGPSQNILSGLVGVEGGQKPKTDDENKIIPPKIEVEGNAYGLKIMSIGFMVDTAKALVWRGPMVQSAIYQFFRDVRWNEGDGGADDLLDVLIVDMPPGTGDAQLTLAQKIDVDGAIIVSTPQDLALADARRGVQMFEATNVPVLGLIENMSTHICSNCGHEEHIFGHGGAAREAEKLGIGFLGAVPLSIHIREACDAGKSFDLPQDIIDKVRNSLHN